MAEIYLSDPDLTIWHGDALAALCQMPEASVDCVVTSPPYWGLRDYGEEGQLGLESTPEQYVERMVEVFREVRRVLAAHGTVWLNLGDSYNAGTSARRKSSQDNDVGYWQQGGEMGDERLNFPGLKPKDLCGLPWRVAFALQADGWYLRSDIIWSKPNPMPESVTDRPTKAHEFVFLLSKQPRYFFDQFAVREKATWERWGAQTQVKSYEGIGKAAMVAWRSKNEIAEKLDTSSRNIRSVWTIPTQPYADAHFATFPMELPRRAIAAGCPLQVCRECGQPRTRIVERETAPSEIREKDETTLPPTEAQDFRIHNFSGQRYQDWLEEHPPETVGWTDCGHDAYRTGVVLDPFFGSGTTALAARALSRNAVGIELNEEYCALAARRLQQLSLLSDVAET